MEASGLPSGYHSGLRIMLSWVQLHRRQKAHECTVLHCTEPFIITLLSSQYDLNNFERDLKHQIEGWAQDYGNSNIFLKPLFRGNLDPFVNNANLGAIAHTSNGT